MNTKPRMIISLFLSSTFLTSISASLLPSFPPFPPYPPYPPSFLPSLLPPQPELMNKPYIHISVPCLIPAKFFFLPFQSIECEASESSYVNIASLISRRWRLPPPPPPHSLLSALFLIILLFLAIYFLLIFHFSHLLPRLLFLLLLLLFFHLFFLLLLPSSRRETWARISFNTLL